MQYQDCYIKTQQAFRERDCSGRHRCQVDWHKHKKTKKIIAQ